VERIKVCQRASHGIGEKVAVREGRSPEGWQEVKRRALSRSLGHRTGRCNSDTYLAMAKIEIRLLQLSVVVECKVQLRPVTC
jgi:hypothetical protein